VSELAVFVEQIDRRELARLRQIERAAGKLDLTAHKTELPGGGWGTIRESVVVVDPVDFAALRAALNPRLDTAPPVSTPSAGSGGPESPLLVENPGARRLDQQATSPGGH
jgi:hypothetical protein